MSLCLRPVIEQWGESYYYSVDHDEVVNLLREIGARADVGRTWQHDYGDLGVFVIEKGAQFLDFLLGGRAALFEAKEQGKDNYDLTDDEIEAVEQMANLVTAWRRSIDPDDGFLRILRRLSILPPDLKHKVRGARSAGGNRSSLAASPRVPCSAGHERQLKPSVPTGAQP